MTIHFDNYAEPVGRHGDKQYYRWRVFVQESAATLDRIGSVEYVLHSTFPEPFQTRTDPRDGFALESSGWGSFLIAIRVNFKDGSKEDVSYFLDLKKPWPNPIA